MGVAPIAVPQGLAYVLNSAGDKSNVDFDYLLQTAMRESSLNPEAKAPSSSAVGLFQFLESTWLQTMKEQGPRLGYQQYADAISVDAEGDYVVRNKAMRKEILALREDPQIAADMAAAFTQSNGDYLAAKFGKQIRYAERRGIPYVWFPRTGDEQDEVKDIRSGEQVAADSEIWSPPAADLYPTVTPTNDG